MSKTVFLLGAGASHDADLPLMAELTTGFRTWIARSTTADASAQLRLFDAASAAVSDTGAPNIELILSLLASVLSFKDGPYVRAIASWQPPFDATGQQVAELAHQIRIYIVERLREGSAGVAAYLAGLFDFVGADGDAEPLDIFTLNYDRLLEATCIHRDVRFTTGFGDRWDPRLFTEGAWDARVFKLHGSLDWYLLPGRQIIYQGAKDSFAYPAETPVEALLYPADGKATHADPYATLMSFFTASLSRADLCISIGYSFRDSDILRRVLDHLVTNRRLQLLIVDPSAAEIRSRIADGMSRPSFADFDGRIITLSSGAQRALNDRRIRHRIDQIREADTVVAGVVQNRNAGYFAGTATALLAALEKCRVLTMPDKSVGLLADVAEGEYRTATLEAMRVAANGVAGCIGHPTLLFVGSAQGGIAGGQGNREAWFGELIMLWLLADVIAANEERDALATCLQDALVRQLRGLVVVKDRAFLAWPDVLGPAGAADQVVRTAATEVRAFGRALVETPPLAVLQRAGSDAQQKYASLERGVVAIGDYLTYIDQGGVRRHVLSGAASVYVPAWDSWRVTLYNPADALDPLVMRFRDIVNSGIIQDWLPSAVTGVSSSLIPA